MFGSAKLKVPNGKLVISKVRFSETIESVQILGDFFMHPEEGVFRIEESLNGLGVSEPEGRISEIINAVVKKERIEMIGVDTASIAKVVTVAIRNGMASN